MKIVLIMGLLFVGMVMLYAVLAVFFPEWVGITGKKSKQVNDSHQDLESVESMCYSVTGIPEPLSSVESKIQPVVSEILKNVDLKNNDLTIDFEGNSSNLHPKVILKPRT